MSDQCSHNTFGIRVEDPSTGSNDEAAGQLIGPPIVLETLIDPLVLVHENHATVLGTELVGVYNDATDLFANRKARVR